MCVRQVILLILQSDHMVGGPWAVNAGWPANSRKGSLWTSNSQYYMPDTNPIMDRWAGRPRGAAGEP